MLRLSRILLRADFIPFFCGTLKRVFSHSILGSYDDSTNVEGLLSASLCLVNLLSSEQCSQFDRFRLQHVKIVNKTSRKKDR